MDEAQGPTLEELAGLLETAAGGNHDPEARNTLRWLIDKSAGELYAELTAKPSDAPSPLELARLLCAVTSQAGMSETLETAHWLIAQSELIFELHKQLEQAALDTGTEIKIWNRMEVLDYEHQLKRLYEATDNWQHPDDVLDPTRNNGVNYQALYSLCCTWIKHTKGKTRLRLETVRDRLERPAELERLLPYFGRSFERLKEWLHDVRDVESAVDGLEEMARLLRSALERKAKPSSAR